MIINTEKIKRKIFVDGLKQEHIAKELGISQATFSRIINNERELKINEYFSLKNILNLTDEEFVEYLQYNIEKEV